MVLVGVKSALVRMTDPFGLRRPLEPLLCLHQRKVCLQSVVFMQSNIKTASGPGSAIVVLLDVKSALAGINLLR